MADRPDIGTSPFALLLEEAAGLDVDAATIRQLGDCVSDEVLVLLLVARARAISHDRQEIWKQDLPITARLQVQIEDFLHLDVASAAMPALTDLTVLPQGRLALSSDARARLSEVAGGRTVGLARAVKDVGPDQGRLSGSSWERLATQVGQLI